LASLLVVSLGNAFSKMSLPLSGQTGSNRCSSDIAHLIKVLS